MRFLQLPNLPLGLALKNVSKQLDLVLPHVYHPRCCVHWKQCCHSSRDAVSLTCVSCPASRNIPIGTSVTFRCFRHDREQWKYKYAVSVRYYYCTFFYPSSASLQYSRCVPLISLPHSPAWLLFLMPILPLSSPLISRLKLQPKHLQSIKSLPDTSSSTAEPRLSGPLLNSERLHRVQLLKPQTGIPHLCGSQAHLLRQEILKFLARLLPLLNNMTRVCRPRLVFAHETKSALQNISNPSRLVLRRSTSTLTPVLLICKMTSTIVTLSPYLTTRQLGVRIRTQDYRLSHHLRPGQHCQTALR